MMKALTKIRSQNKKILGICKGLQLINVFCGGTLLQDLPQAEFHNQYTKQYEVVHGIHLHKDSFLEKAFGSDTIQVNSIHHQAVDTLGKGCAIAGYAENDKTIEAIENISYGRYGVQWHPESLAKHQKLFNWFVQQCSSS